MPILPIYGEILDTYTMNGITADNKITGVAVKHQGNRGEMVAIPFALEMAPEHIHAPAMLALIRYGDAVAAIG
jgi:hypothetical protein